MKLLLAFAALSVIPQTQADPLYQFKNITVARYAGADRVPECGRLANVFDALTSPKSRVKTNCVPSVTTDQITLMIDVELTEAVVVVRGPGYSESEGLAQCARDMNTLRLIQDPGVSILGNCHFVMDESDGTMSDAKISVQFKAR